MATGELPKAIYGVEGKDDYLRCARSAFFWDAGNAYQRRSQKANNIVEVIHIWSPRPIYYRWWLEVFRPGDTCARNFEYEFLIQIIGMTTSVPSCSSYHPGSMTSGDSNFRGKLGAEPSRFVTFLVLLRELIPPFALDRLKHRILCAQQVRRP